MVHHTGALRAARIFVLVLLALSAAGWAPSAKKRKVMTSTLSESMLLRLDEGDTFSSREAMEFRREPNAVARLATAMEGASPNRRHAGLDLLIQIGRPALRPLADMPEVPGPIVDNPAVVQILTHLLVDPDDEVRRRACVTLAGLVPGDMIQSRAVDVLAALKRFPETDGSLVLLGKVGTEEALQLVASRPEISQATPDDVRMVRARLGDRSAEAAEIAAYASAPNPQVKANAARRLGYVGTPQSVKVLAQDLRTPLTYVWLWKAERSFRLHLIEGLHLAYMREPIFWRPYLKPSDDSYYAAIEKWLAEHLKITWDNPRPPFLYEEDSPTPATPQEPPTR
jgi:HEAT repeat protein